ncbi:probable prefoldin subunit 2 [Nilaparvata lugens]|uniref:probable prefoldin subunit 2 n=1 Tax=Nilaparvata lugens TaxID=108931 RepID=UPI00193E2D2A|nr:probable prefoldin subunit 2 [Nilaparvata lugens]
MATDSTKVRTAKGKQLSNEEIYNGFQKLRNEQRLLANKLTEVEVDFNEHKIVIGTLQDLDGDRKCFRMFGGVLCQRTVKDVLPNLISTRDQLKNLIETLNDQLTKKGAEINEYKEKYDIRFQREMGGPSGSGGGGGGASQEGGEKKSEPSRNVIMVNPM